METIYEKFQIVAWLFFFAIGLLVYYSKQVGVQELQCDTWHDASM